MAHCIYLGDRETQITLLLESPSLADNLAGEAMRKDPDLSLHEAHRIADLSCALLDTTAPKRYL